MLTHLQILWILKFHLLLYSEQLETSGIRMLRCVLLIFIWALSYVMGRQGEE